VTIAKPTIKIAKPTISIRKPIKKPTNLTPVKKQTNFFGSCNSLRRYPDFKQYDNRWKDDKMGKSQTTILKSGSLMTSFSMILNALDKQLNSQTTTPKSLNAWLNANMGYNNDKINFSVFSKLGLKQIKSVNKNDINKHVCSSNSVILKLKDGFALATGIDQDQKTILINDPTFSARNKVDQKDVIKAIVFADSK
jgi:hypothetical protein